MSEFKQIKTFQKALEVARAFAANYDVNDSKAEAYAESWYEAGKDYDKASADDLRAYLLRRFDLA